MRLITTNSDEKKFTISIHIRVVNIRRNLRNKSLVFLLIENILVLDNDIFGIKALFNLLDYKK